MTSLANDTRWMDAVEQAALVIRFRNAGLVIAGRTNSPELGSVPTTESLAWGATHNPWDIGARRAPVRNDVDELGAEPGRLRIRLLDHHPPGGPVAPEC